MRAVLDPNVIVSALLSPGGAPGQILRGWLEGRFELIVSPALIEELGRVLSYPKLRKWVSPAEAQELLALLRTAELIEDPIVPPPQHSADPGDDYLIALAAGARAVLVSGDHHLLDLQGVMPAFSPAQFLAQIQDR